MTALPMVGTGLHFASAAPSVQLVASASLAGWHDTGGES